MTRASLPLVLSLMLLGCSKPAEAPADNDVPSSDETDSPKSVVSKPPMKPLSPPEFSLEEKNTCQTDSDCVLSARETEDGPLSMFCCVTCPGTLSYNKTYEEAWTRFCEQRPNPDACPSVTCVDGTVRRAFCWGASDKSPGVCSSQEQTENGEWIPKR